VDIGADNQTRTATDPPTPRPPQPLINTHADSAH